MTRTIFSVAAMILFGVPLQAAEIRWGRGTADGDFIGNYADGTKWDGGAVPGPLDRARVDRGGTEMTLDSTIVANDFLFGVDEEPQFFDFMPTADVTLASNFIAGLNRGQLTMDIQQGASLSVGNNFLLGQQVFCCGGVSLFDSDITATIAGDVVVADVTILGDQYDGEAILTDVLLDVSSGTLTANNIAFAPNGDLTAYVAAGNTMQVNVGDGALISLAGDRVATIQEQIDAGLYTTDSTQGTLLASYDLDTDRTLIQVGTSPVCDFNGNTLCNIDDLNLMLAEGPIAPGVPVVDGVNDEFDLNGDNVINNSDRDIWLADAATENGFGSPYLVADANLNGSVDVTDLNLWNGNKFNPTLQWDQGDFTGDGSADVSDFNAWNTNKFSSSATATVPEPTSALLLLITSLCGILVKGRCHTS